MEELKEMESYLEFSWDPKDLVCSKAMVNVMIHNGVTPEEILGLNFGNLDVVAVLEENGIEL